MSRHQSRKAGEVWLCRAVRPENLVGMPLLFCDVKLGADESLDAFRSGQPQAKHAALALQVDVKIEERTAFALGIDPLG